MTLSISSALLAVKRFILDDEKTYKRIMKFLSR